MYQPMTTTRRVVLTTLILTCLVGSSCSSGVNPILGKWTPKNTGGILSASDIQFTPDQVIYHNGSDPNDRVLAEYKVSGRKVTVIPKGGMMPPFVCEAKDDGTLLCDMPMAGKTVYLPRGK